MPRIADLLQKSIVYLYATLDDAQNARPSGGTGFFVTVPFEQKFNDEQYEHIYLVTNEHVVSGGIEAIRLNLHEGTSQSFVLDSNKWEFPDSGDDLAVYHFPFSYSTYDHAPIPSFLFITQDFIDEHDVGLGDEAFIVGRFRYHEGRSRNYPSARFGNIGQMPNEPVIIKRAANYDAKQDAFLVEMRSIAGYSGSPAFLYIPPFTHRWTKEPRDLDNFTCVRFLGVDCGHLTTKDLLKKSNGNRVRGCYVEGNSAMTLVVPAWKLQEFLDMPRLKEQRVKLENKYAEKMFQDDTPNVALDAIQPDDEPPFTKADFEKALRKVNRPTQQHRPPDSGI